MASGRQYPHHADDIEPEGNFDTPTNAPNIYDGTYDEGGWSVIEGHGPYNIPFGESVNIVVADAVGELQVAQQPDVQVEQCREPSARRHHCRKPRGRGLFELGDHLGGHRVREIREEEGGEAAEDIRVDDEGLRICSRFRTHERTDHHRAAVYGRYLSSQSP